MVDMPSNYKPNQNIAKYLTPSRIKLKEYSFKDNVKNFCFISFIHLNQLL